MGGDAPLLFLDETEARRAEKDFFETCPPLSQGLDDFPPAYLRVLIRHCNILTLSSFFIKSSFVA